MKKMVMLVIVIMLTACSSEPKSVKYYEEHEQERKEQVQKNIENPGKWSKDLNVINAVQAQRNINDRNTWKGFGKTKANSEGAGSFVLK